MREQSGPRTFWVERHFQGGVSVCDDTDENCPWRRNPAMKVGDARLIREVSSVAFVAVDENAGAGSNVAYGARKTSSVDLSGRSADWRSEEDTSELQSRQYLVCRLLLEKKKKNKSTRQQSNTNDITII